MWSTFWIVVLTIALFTSFYFLDRRKTELSELHKKNAERNAEYTKATAAQEAEHKKQIDAILYRMEGLQKIVEQRKIQFPWLASAIADFHQLNAERDAIYLVTKKHAAKKSADIVREHGRKRRQAEVTSRLMRYRVEYYQKLFPWIVDLVGDDVPDAAVDLSGSQVEPTDDPARIWLSDAEYQNLSVAAKNQLAVDRWRTSKKSNWEIGRDYERFIGYTYETLGYNVTFSGAIDGLQDMGRDIIARRGSELRVIQCKYWSQDKTIHEKHIFQLFGSALEYAFRLGTFDEIGQLALFGGPIKATGTVAVLYTSTKVSDLAKDVAKKLQVECNEQVRISDYPLVKMQYIDA
jgi:Restriction endonuclease